MKGSANLGFYTSLAAPLYGRGHFRVKAGATELELGREVSTSRAATVLDLTCAPALEKCLSNRSNTSSDAEF